MNVSLKNNVIWLAPERTAGKFLKEIFKNYDFFSCDKKNQFQLKDLRQYSHSHGNTIPEVYRDLPIILSIRNPYDRIWSYYVNFYAKNFRPKEFEQTKQKFNEFVNNVFKFTLEGVVTDPFFSGDDYFNRWRLGKTTPTAFIRFENIKNDVLSLDFVKKQPNLFDESIFDDKTYKSDRFLTFDLMYEQKTAKKVFNFYKNHFFSFGYNPLSFTKENLTDEEKINFFHTYS